MKVQSRLNRGMPRWLVLVGAMSAVGPVSIDMYLPAFPLIERDLAQDGVERTMAAYLIGISMGQLFYGPLSDRYGRKTPLYAGFALYTIGALGCAFAGSMLMLTVMRVVQALGACTGFVIGRAIVRDRCEPHEAARAFSTLMLIVALGPMLAPILGGWVVTVFDWRAIFAFQAALGLGLLLAMHFMLAESRDPASVRPLQIRSVLRTYVLLARDRELVGYSLVAGFGMGSMFCYIAGAPTVLTQVYALSPQQFGWLIGLNGIAFMSASRINLHSLRLREPGELLPRLIWIPTLISVALTALTLIGPVPLWLLLALQFSFFVSIGRLNPNVAALALAAHGRDAGTASALAGSLQSLIATLAGVAVAIFNDGTLSTLVTLMTVGAVLTWVSYVWAKGAEK